MSPICAAACCVNSSSEYQTCSSGSRHNRAGRGLLPVPCAAKTALLLSSVPSLIQRPPVIKQAAVEIPFHRNAAAAADSPAGFPLDPSLAVAVLRVLDMLA